MTRRRLIGIGTALVVTAGVWWRPSLSAQGSALTLFASPSSIIVGQSSTLTYSVTISLGALGSPTFTGSTTVTPPTTTTYAASVGSLSAQATVTVNPAPPPPAAQWVAVCNTTGAGTTLASTCTTPGARGYNWRLPYDPINQEFLYFGNDPNSAVIYSTSLYGYKPRVGTFTPRVIQNPVDNLHTCGINGGSAALLNPKGGHPLGFQAFDSARNRWLAEGGLCGGYDNGFTSQYDATSRSMLAPLAAWDYSPVCDGTFTCGQIAWDTGMEFVAGYGKTILCCNGGGYGLRVVEFDGAQYTNVTDRQVGADGILCANGSTHCPPYLNAAGLLSDGSALYLFGGCAGSSPGNGVNCSGTLLNDLYRYDPAAYRWTKLAPSGGVKPPATNTAFPWVAYDSTRARFVYYDGSQLWQFLIATSTWSTFTAAGSGPVMDSYLQAHSDGNAAGYDPATDTIVLVYMRGQWVSPGLFELRFN